jgi:hypothetical protein
LAHGFQGFQGLFGFCNFRAKLQPALLLLLKHLHTDACVRGEWVGEPGRKSA